MNDVPQSPQHVSGRREPDEPPHHGINVGSGLECREHSYSNIDNDGKAVKRDESLTEILISKGVQEVNLISAIVSLGEGEMQALLLVLFYLLQQYHLLLIFVAIDFDASPLITAYCK